MKLDHDLLKADLAAAQEELGVVIRSEQTTHAGDGGRMVRERVLEVKLPKRSPVCARFVREGLIERAKKLFVDEVEVGSSWFDDHVYVVTSTREATSALLESERVQQALILLVDPSRHVEVDHDTVRVVDDDALDDGRDASAELLAFVAHLV
ncbi:MAG: hypothetical protein QM778_24385 [Myxococcales bacterium]